MANLFIPKLILIKKSLFSFSFYGPMKLISVQAAMKEMRERCIKSINTCINICILL